jgi:acyl-CoA synthetase (AMP-forming)/AMP-acid ligase II
MIKTSNSSLLLGTAFVPPFIPRHQIETMAPFKRPPVTLHPASSDQPIRTIPELIDYNATHNPDVSFCVQAVKDAAPVQITFGQLRDAISRRCTQLRVDLQLKPGPKKSAPVALVMDSDVVLLVHLFALMGLGVPVRGKSTAHAKEQEEWILRNGC